MSHLMDSFEAMVVATNRTGNSTNAAAAATTNQTENHFWRNLHELELELPEVEEANLHSRIFNSLLIVFYSILAVVSLIGNGLVCRVLLAPKRSAYPPANTGARTSKILIVNLAISDLLLTTFNIPINIVRFVSRDWPFGIAICTMMPFIQSVSAYCSSWTMMIIAFERYRKIFQSRSFHRSHQPSVMAKPLQPMQHASVNNHQLWEKINPTIWTSLNQFCNQIRTLFCYSCCAYCCCCLPKKYLPLPPGSRNYVNNTTTCRVCNHRYSSLLTVAIVWLVALVLSTPHSLYSRIVHYDYIDMTRCTINAYPSEQTKMRLAVYTVLTQYICPIGITTFCYIHIGIFLWQRETIGSLSEGRKLYLLKRKRKRVQMLILVVAVFAICWLPLNLYSLLTDFNIIPHHLLLFFIVHWFAMSSVCYNPFIYCWLNEMFRQKTKTILKYLLWNWPTWFGAICCKGRVPANPFTHMATIVRHAPDGEKQLDSASWSSTTMSATGQQQAISELISMSALLEQQDPGDGKCRGQTLSKEQRLALMTTQSGRRRYHSSELMRMFQVNEDATKTTSINLVSETSSSTIVEEHPMIINSLVEKV